MKTLEYEISDSMLLVGSVEKIDASFDHAFGFRKQTEYEVSDFSVMILCTPLTQWEAITFADESTLKRLKNKFLEWAITNDSFSREPNFDDAG